MGLPQSQMPHDNAYKAPNKKNVIVALLSMHHNLSHWRHRILSNLCYWLCRQIPARELGRIFERLQIAFAGNDPRIGQYALDYNNPQALCFLIDIYPILQKIFSTYPRMKTIHLLDIGPAFGASAGLLSELHRSHFLGPRVKVDVLDITDSRRDFIEMTYPLIDFLHCRIEEVPTDRTWDLIYCSNAIEHMADPRTFIRFVMQHTAGRAIFLAPHDEQEPLSEGHLSKITANTFAEFEVETIHVFSTAAWPMTSEGVERQQILAVLKGTHGKLPTLN